MNTHILGGADLAQLDHWIDGRSVKPGAGVYLETVNPMTGAPHLRVAAGTPADVEAAATAAARAADGWRRMPAAERGRLMQVLAALLRANRQTLAEMERARYRQTHGRRSGRG